MSVTTEANQAVQIAKTTNRPDLVDGDDGYAQHAKKYKKELEDWQTNFYVLFKKLEELYSNLPEEAKTWYAGAHQKLSEFKAKLIEQSPFPLEEAPT